MAKRDKLSDRLNRLRVDLPMSSYDSNSEDDTTEFVVVEETSDEQHRPTQPSSALVDRVPAPQMPTETAEEIAAREAEKAKAAALREQQLREEEERQAAELAKRKEEELRAEQERIELREQKEREKREHKELQEQKKREREAEKEALRKAKLERLRLEEERKLKEEQARRDEKARLAEIERAEKAKQAEIERAEREKQAEIQRAEKEKQAEIEKAEREKSEALRRLELEKQAELEKARLQKAEEIARAQKEAEDELNKIEQEKKALLEKARSEEIERQAQIEKQRIAAKAEAERAERERREEVAREKKARKAEISRERKRQKEEAKRQREKEKLLKAHSSSANKKPFSIFSEDTKAYMVSIKIRTAIKALFVRIGSFFKNLTPKRAVICFFILFFAVCVINRLPSFIYGFIKSDDDQKTNFSCIVNDNFMNTSSQAASDHPNEDFDLDGIPNGTDGHPYDPDYNIDGVLDSDEISKFSVGSPIKVGNLIFEIDSPISGITQYLDMYDADRLKDKWVKCELKDKVPYAYYDGNWHELETEKRKDGIYFQIPADDCRIKLLGSNSDNRTSVTIFGKKRFSYSNNGIGGKILGCIFTLLYPEDNGCPLTIGYRSNYIEYFADEKNTKDIISKASVSRINEANLSRFSGETLDSDGLDIIYAQLKEGKTSLLSLQSEKGEVIVIVYGCDYLGNLYVADYRDPSVTGKLTISVTPHYIRKTSGGIRDISCITFTGGKIDKSFRPVLIR